MIRFYRDKAGLTLEKLAERIGCSVSYLSKMERTARRTNTEWLGKIATELSVNVSDLLMAHPPELTQDTRWVRILGAVQAGKWLEAVEVDRVDTQLLPVPADTKYKHAYALEVRGSSMNLLFPEGSHVICVGVYDFWRDVRHGDKVVVHRRSPAGLIEATVKELVIDANDRFWLWPRSTSPEHQAPIEVPSPLPLNDVDLHPEISVHAVVIGALIALA